MYYELVLQNEHGHPVLTQLPKFGPCESREVAIALGYDLYAQYNRESRVAVYFGPRRLDPSGPEPHGFPIKVAATKPLLVIG